MRATKFITAGLFATLAACSTTSGVHEIAEGTFTVSTSASWGRGGLDAAADIAYTEAEAKCAGKSVQRTEENRKPRNVWHDNMAHVTLEFRCVGSTRPS